MDLRSSSITADILNYLSDGKVHSLQEIADEIEVSKKTIQRHIQSLSYRYPIETFCGGINRGGVYLDKHSIIGTKILSKDELQVINKALVLLQKNMCENDKPELTEGLLKVFSISKNKENSNGEHKKCC